LKDIPGEPFSGEKGFSHPIPADQALDRQQDPGYAFCFVVSMTLMRVIQWKARTAGYTMSLHVLKEELSDIQEVAMAYRIRRPYQDHGSERRSKQTVGGFQA
jgi:hypothetical protein